MRRFVPGLMLLVLLIMIGYGLSPQGRAVTEAASLLVDVWSIDKAPPARGPRRRVTADYPGPGGEPRVADVYCDPATPARARFLVVHGLVESGKDDPRLHALGAALARHRFLVMVPDFPGMRSLRVSPRDIDEVEAALIALARFDRCPPPIARATPLETGVIGFSYSAGPVLLALDRGARAADFAVLFGGYYDMVDLILFLTTGRHRDRGADFGGEALPEGRWILLGANADLFAEPADRAALLAISRRRRADPAAYIGDLEESLGPRARAALDLLTNTNPDRFDPLLAKIDPAIRRTIDDLSPSKSLKRPLQVDLYLMHGRSDAIVPYTETLKLAREVRTSGTVEVALLGGFRHARPAGAAADPWWRPALAYPGDSLRLFRILTEILERRGRKSLTDGGPDRG